MCRVVRMDHVVISGKMDKFRRIEDGGEKEGKRKERAGGD
jgi:hypothetical protein